MGSPLKEDKFRILSDSAQDAIVVIDNNGKITYWNEAAEKIFGYTEREIIDKELVTVIITKSYQEAFRKRFRKFQKIGEGPVFGETVEVKGLKKDGTELPVEFSLLGVKINGQWNVIGIVSDITERKQAEETLKKSEEKLQYIIDNAWDIIFQIDLKGKYTFANKTAARVTGYSLDELLGMNMCELIAPEYQQSIFGRLKKRIAGEPLEQPFDFEIVHKDGHRITVELTTTPIYVDDGKLVGVQGIARDITEQKRAEEALRFQSEITINMSEGVYLIRAEDGIIVYANPKFEEIFGYDPGEIVGKHVSIVNAPTEKDPKETAKEIISILNKTGVWRGEIKNIKKDGTPFWCYANVSTFDHPDYGKVWVTVHIDITERKLAEEASKGVEEVLRESEERFRNLTETTSDWIWEVDEQGIYTYASPKVKELLGYEPEELIGKTPFDLMSSEEAKRVASEFGVIIESRKSFSLLENTNLHKDGRPIVLETSGVPIFDVEGNFRGYRGIDRDITERKKVEMVLAESESKLREQKSALEQKNIALREMIEQITIEREKVQDDIVTNVHMVLFPILKNLRTEKASLKYVDLLQHHLERLTSSYGSKIIKKGFKLTSREIEVCNLVKAGLMSKDISDFLNISTQTVEKHRENIRYKLGISNKSINLVFFLHKL